MDAVFLKSDSAKATRSTFQIARGRYAALLLIVEGTTAAGQTLALADLGTVQITRNGTEIVNAEMEFLNKLTDIKSGYPEKPTGNAATAERVSMVIPFYQNGYPNVLQSQTDQEVTVVLAFATAMATRFGANAVTFSLYGLLQQDVYETYQLFIRPQNMTAAGSGDFNQTLNARNLVAVYLKSSVVDRIQLTVDGKLVVENIPLSVLRTITNIENRIETAGQDWVDIEIAASGVPDQTVNNAAELKATFSGSGVLSAYNFNVLWNDAQTTARNAAQVNNYLAAKVRG